LVIIIIMVIRNIDSWMVIVTTNLGIIMFSPGFFIRSVFPLSTVGTLTVIINMSTVIIFLRFIDHLIIIILTSIILLLMIIIIIMKSTILMRYIWLIIIIIMMYILLTITNIGHRTLTLRVLGDHTIQHNRRYSLMLQPCIFILLSIIILMQLSIIILMLLLVVRSDPICHYYIALLLSHTKIIEHIASWLPFIYFRIQQHL